MICVPTHNLKHATKIAGVDEAGRGPLAGPVVAAAVIIPMGVKIEGLADSKKLTEAKRQKLAEQIKLNCQFSIAKASVEEIDQLNIHHATLLAMKRAVEGLSEIPDEAWIDGLYAPKIQCLTKTFVKGDSLHEVISAASILAKVLRDQLMVEYDATYPGYGFLKHKGYPTKHHLAALKQQGICKIHRKSYAPVKALLDP